MESIDIKQLPVKDELKSVPASNSSNPAGPAGQAEEALSVADSLNSDEDCYRTYDCFIRGVDPDLSEVNGLNTVIDGLNDIGEYTYESVHLTSQSTETKIKRQTGETFKVINMACYNYLGYGQHPEVIKAAKDALDHFGLGAASSPVLSGTLSLHEKLETSLLEFFNMPDHGVSLFTSGFGVNIGTISAIMKPGSHIILDKAVHMSILEGAQLSRAKLHFFNHNDMEKLEKILQRVVNKKTRTLICVEGLYSTEGDVGNLREVIRLAKQYGALSLVDEAHSTLLAGEHGCGFSEEHGVLRDVDFYVMTFSKAFSAVGGAVLARKDLARYINWYARCRMFSCALAPAATGGIIKVLELASSEDGRLRRERLHENVKYMHNLLRGKVNVLNSETWIIPVVYGDERLTMPISDYLQRHGLDAGHMMFPAVPKNEAIIRLFVTSEHTEAQMQKAAEIVLSAAEKFNFLI